MSEKDVVAVLGAPDEKNPTYEPAVKNGRQIGFSYVYTLRKLKGSGSVDEMGEQSIRVHFDLAGSFLRVVEIGDWRATSTSSTRGIKTRDGHE